MKTNISRIMILANVILAAGIVFSIFYKRDEKKIVYVEIGKLYKEFKLTKELESQYKNVANARKLFLDSLEIRIRSIMDDNSREKEINEMKNQYVLKKQQFDEDNNAMNTQLNGQIMNQLNQYMTDYGQENGFDFIFGAEGSGAIMYADEKSYNLTEPVLAFINSKYEGKNK